MISVADITSRWRCDSWRFPLVRVLTMNFEAYVQTGINTRRLLRFVDVRQHSKKVM